MKSTFGLWLQHQIDERLWTLAEFCRRSGFAYRTVTLWMSGSYSPCGTSIVRIARTLNVDRSIIDEILGETIAA